ncbi:MAG: phospholipase A [Parasulfuritortus sp.]|nr:phospholipase A [Parasulfuritortus sp.]
MKNWMMSGLLLAFCGLVVLPASAASPWLIATPDESARAGEPVVLEVVKPATQTDWPTRLRLRLVQDGRVSVVDLALDEQDTAGDARRTYRGVIPRSLSGLVRVDLVGDQSNRQALLIASSDAIARMQTPAQVEAMPTAEQAGTENLLFPVNEPALSANEPMYFVVGGSGRTSTRFQLSFKYRLFDPGSLPVEWLPPLSGLHFGYTQTSLWDVGTASAPFHDTSYRPSFFWQGTFFGKGAWPEQLRGGIEHESNGRDGAGSRSINILFAQPVWSRGFADGRALILAPKFYGYLGKSDNPDIQRYRGYVDWNVRYGKEDGWLLTALLREGTAGHGSTQLDFSYPLRRPLFTQVGGFLHLQLFKGYGQDLLDYNVGSDLQARIGFSIVR